MLAFPSVITSPIHVADESDNLFLFPEITCENTPTDPPNGALSAGSNTLGTIRIFVCDDGFVFNESSHITVCQADKTWSLTNVTCLGKCLNGLLLDG